MAIDEQTIIAASLDLLRRDGLPGITFRALTAELGVRAPAIYWRFADKQALLDAIAESILHRRFGDLEAYGGTEPLDAWLKELFRELRRAMLDFPDGARVVTGARPLGAPTLAHLAELALQACESAAMDATVSAAIVFTAMHFTFGRAIEEQASTAAEHMDSTTAVQFAALFPTVARLISDPTLATTAADRFEASLSLIIDPARLT